MVHLGIDEHRRGRPCWQKNEETGKYEQQPLKAGAAAAVRKTAKRAGSALGSAARGVKSKAKLGLAAAVAVGAVAAGGQPAMAGTTPAHIAPKTPATATASAHGGTITTTFRHPFYDQTQAAFVEAQHLHAGDVLQTPAGTAKVTAVRLFHANTVTYDLTIGTLRTYYVVAGTTPVLVHNCDDVGRQVESGSTDLSKATRAARKVDSNRGNLYGAARVGKRIFVDHSDANGHAEEYLLQKVRDAGFKPEDIDELYTEYGMCPRCQGPGGKRAVLPLLRSDADITYSIPFANPASRPAARVALKALVASIFS